MPFLVVHFVKKNTYSVINDESDKLKNSKKARVMFESGKWFNGNIVFRGTENQCNKYGKHTLSEVQYKPIDDEMSEFETIEPLDKLGTFNLLNFFIIYAYI